MDGYKRGAVNRKQAPFIADLNLDLEETEEKRNEEGTDAITNSLTSIYQKSMLKYYFHYDIRQTRQ